MNATPPLMILPVSLADLAPRTRDWLLAKSSRLGTSPIEVLNAELQTIAERELRDAPRREVAS